MQKSSAISTFPRPYNIAFYLFFCRPSRRDLFEERTKSPRREMACGAGYTAFRAKPDLCRFELVKICDFATNSLSVNSSRQVGTLTSDSASPPRGRRPIKTHFKAGEKKQTWSPVS